MLLGYNTNGFAHHNLADAIEILAEIGYRSVAITVDHGSLNPYRSELPKQLECVAAQLESCGMRSVIETGARFLLDPRVKHEPTLMTLDSEKRALRIDFLCRCVDVARRLGSDCVSIWSGTLRQEMPEDQAFSLLLDGLQRVLEYATRQNIPLGFEPEPGMFIDTMDRFDRLSRSLDTPYFKLTLDVGHLHCMGETPIRRYIDLFGDRITNVHVEDMCQGVHEHLMFGDGEMDFPPILEALAQARYQGGLHVELSRHSHDAVAAAQRAYTFLAPLLYKGTSASEEGDF